MQHVDTRPIQASRLMLLLLALLLSFALAACGANEPGQPSAAQPPTSVPAPTAPAVTAIPTAMQPAPSAAPATPAPSRLPAPLYFQDQDGQIVRMETDGATHTTITHEPDAIAWFDISPRDGSIIFTTEEQGTLVRVDAHGANRTELLKGSIRGLQWAPDGQAFVIRWEDGPQGSGIYKVAADGMSTLILKNKPFNPRQQTAGLTFEPLKWSPDGTRLLLLTAPDNGPDMPSGDLGSAGMVVADMAGKITELVQIGGKPFLCSQEFWSNDGTMIYCAQEGYADQAPPLWRIPAAGGAPETLVQPANGQQITFFNTVQLSDGGIYGFVSVGRTGAHTEVYKMQRRNADGGDAIDLRDDTFSAIAVLPTLWANDGSGAIIKDQRIAGDQGLLWLPADGSAPRPLPEAFQLNLRWGRP
jgi:Tol biopolymer transport system component